MKRKPFGFSILGLFLFAALLRIEAWAAPGLYEFFCAEIQSQQNGAIAYQTTDNKFIENIQLLETYKRFKACQKLDSQVQLQESYHSLQSQLEYLLIEPKSYSSPRLDQLNQRLLSIFVHTQRKYLNFVQELIAKNPDSLRAQKLREWSERIGSVRLQKAKLCHMHNAAYDPVSHSISVCKEILNYPETTLVAVLAHELSHGIDPCMLQFTFSRISGGNPFFTRETVFNPNDLLSAYTMIPFEWAEADFDVKKENFQSLQLGRSFSENPLRAGIVCLQKENSVRALPRKGKLENSQLMDAEGMCASTQGDGEIQESFADWMAYEIVALSIGELSKEFQRRALFESALNITANECQTLVTPIEQAMRRQIEGSSVCAPLQAKFFQQLDQTRAQTLLSSHPSGQRRIDRLYFAQPRLKALIGQHLGAKNLALPSAGTASYCDPTEYATDGRD